MYILYNCCAGLISFVSGTVPCPVYYQLHHKCTHCYYGAVLTLTHCKLSVLIKDPLTTIASGTKHVRQDCSHRSLR